MSTISRRLDVALAEGDDEALERTIRDIFRDELASLGGHLTAAYGAGAPLPASPEIANPIASLGGYMLEHYGKAST
jgi:hypothetical protein